MSPYKNHLCQHPSGIKTILYLKYGKFPIGMSSKESISLKMKIDQSVLISRVIFQRFFYGILLICLYHLKYKQILQELHEGVCGGHFTPIVTTHKIIWTSYYWPTMFNDTYSMIRKFLQCHKHSGNMKREAMSLQSISVEEPFSQWGLDVIGLINP